MLLSDNLDGRKAFVAGHRGMVGAALVRRLARERCTVLTAGRDVLDLRNPEAVDAWFAAHRPHHVFIAAATVGGILANDTRPAEFLYDNLMIAANVMHAAYRHDSEKVLLLGSSCIYPRMAHQPIAESELLTGPLEPTNQWYAIAKIAGLKMAQAYRRQYGRNFISAMPTNLYGPGDNFDLQASHVIPALMRRAHEAREAGAPELVIWGSGTPRREFLHVDDLADALVHIQRHYSEEEPINVGTGTDVTILEVARMICSVVGYRGKIVLDRTKPDGTPRKLLDVSRLNALGWGAARDLKTGLAETYDWYGRAEARRGTASA